MPGGAVLSKILASPVLFLGAFWPSSSAFKRQFFGKKQKKKNLSWQRKALPNR
jgi:hypothetical protein